MKNKIEKLKFVEKDWVYDSFFECPFCKYKELTDTFRFCPRCGKSLCDYRFYKNRIRSVEENLSLIKDKKIKKESY